MWQPKLATLYFSRNYGTFKQIKHQSKNNMKTFTYFKIWTRIGRIAATQRMRTLSACDINSAQVSSRFPLINHAPVSRASGADCLTRVGHRCRCAFQASVVCTDYLHSLIFRGTRQHSYSFCSGLLASPYDLFVCDNFPPLPSATQTRLIFVFGY